MKAQCFQAVAVGFEYQPAPLHFVQGRPRNDGKELGRRNPDSSDRADPIARAGMRGISPAVFGTTSARSCDIGMDDKCEVRNTARMISAASGMGTRRAAYEPGRTLDWIQRFRRHAGKKKTRGRCVCEISESRV